MGAKTSLAVMTSMAALLFLTSCQRSSSTAGTYVESGPPRYEIECPVGEACDASVALLVGLSAPSEPMRCTAALIGPRTAVTAGHCVAWELAMGSSCADVWLGFAGSESAPPEWVGCHRVSSMLTSAGDLLSPDYAVLELAREPARTPLPLGTGAMKSGEMVRMVSVTADRFYDDRHEVRSRRCVVEDGRRLEPWSRAAPESIRVLSSCPVREGSSGAPVLDAEGRVRGLIHGGGPRFFALGLMTLLPEPIERDDG